MPAVRAQDQERLQLLALSPLEPQRVSRRGLAVSELRKIGAVRVSRRRDVAKGVTEYAISVSPAEATASRLPMTSARRERLGSLWSALCSTVEVHSSSSSASSSSSHAQPVESVAHDASEMLTAAKRLADFEDLRVKVYSLAMTSHNFEACEFCEHALHHALWGGAERYQQQRSALALLILDENKLLETLAALVRDLVALCASPSVCWGDRGATAARVLCRAQDQLPVVVHSFLFDESA